MIKSFKIGKYASCSSYQNGQGHDEFFVVVHSRPDQNDKEAFREVAEIYSDILKKSGLSSSSQVFTRLCVSDLANEKEALYSSVLWKMISKGAHSAVDQSPLAEGRISLFSYHINGKLIKEQPDPGSGRRMNISSFKGKNYSMLWAANMMAQKGEDSKEQTDDVFLSYNSFLKNSGSTLLSSAIRTWIYVRDIDNRYGGMVKARKEFFATESLTPETRFIASTGIEGRLPDTDRLVMMDALAFTNLDPRQIVRMSAPTHMNPTHEYGVTFERGTRLDFGDRSHLYISGTASIDNQGHILYLGDPAKQTARAIDNVKALLKPHGAKSTDLLYLIVYIRNPHDLEAVKKVLSKIWPVNRPILYVNAPVCRPGWLVEIEGTAIIDKSSKWPKFL